MTADLDEAKTLDEFYSTLAAIGEVLKEEDAAPLTGLAALVRLAATVAVAEGIPLRHFEKYVMKDYRRVMAAQQVKRAQA